MIPYSVHVPCGGRYDVTVCGGGFSGFAVAYAAAREGASVLLVERNACLGGVGTSALVNHILGVRKRIGEGRFSVCVQGIFAELEKRLLARKAAVDIRSIDPTLNPHGWKPSLSAGMVFDCEEMKLLLEEMLAEVGVTVLYLTDVIDVQSEGSRLHRIIVHNKDGLSYIEADFFADATGDGDLCFLAGADYLLGDEEGGLAAASLEMHVENVNSNALSDYMRQTGDLRFRSLIEKAKKAGDWNFDYDIFISVQLCRKDVFMINTIRQVGVNGIDARSLSDAILSGRRESYELLHVMKAYFPGFENATIRQIAPMIGIRETRRIVGDYTLTVKDLIDGTEFEDGIALSGYGWDMPHPKSPSIQPFEGIQRKSYVTQIPYRCLVPRGLDNLLAVGRCISTEREVLGPVRVMGPCIAMGEAAGIALAMAKKEGVSVRNLNTKKLREQLISYGALVDRKQVYEI